MKDPNIRFQGGPRDGEGDYQDRLAATIGDGSEGGVYELTDALTDGRRVYAWRALSDQEANAILRGDLRANQ